MKNQRKVSRTLFSVFLLIALVALNAASPIPAAAAPVNIPDATLRRRIEWDLRKNAGAPISTADMATLTRLRASGDSISDLTGLEHATNLTYLELWSTSISDLSALSGLTNLTTLYLDCTSVSDLSALSGLTNLTTLDLGNTSVSDLSALRGLTNLTTLTLDNNSIDNNSISDLSGLSGLTNLNSLSLEDNSLNYRSIYTHIPALRNRGVDVDFTNRVPQAPSKIAGDGQHGAPGAALAHPFVVEVRDAANTPFAGVPITFEITGGGGSLSETATQTDAKGQAETTLTLGATGGLTKVTASVRDAQTLIVPQKVTFTANAPPGNIPDANLRAAIESALGKSAGAPISAADMATLTSLDAESDNISDLIGLEHATNLTSLRLVDTSISDISALRGLTKLTWLELRDNRVSDLSALSGLTKLEWLYLEGNSISDISALSGLTNLTELYLGYNSISDLSPLRGLTKLTWLALWIPDRFMDAYLQGLTKSTLTWLSLWGNPLNYRSIYTHIPALRNRGVEVGFTNRVPQAPSKIAGDWQHGAPGAALTHPFVVEVRDAANTPFAGVPITFEITGGGGSLSETATQTDAKGQAETTLTLGATGGLTKVTASVRDAQTLIVPQKVTFTAAAGAAAMAIPDAGLRAEIERALGKNAGAPISNADMATLTSLSAESDNISDLIGLEHATNLTSLYLWDNSVSDLSALRGLTKLRWLELRDNRVSDLSALSGLTNLTMLYLRNNSISDLSALRGLTNLTDLYLDNNSVSDLSALSGLTNLYRLYLLDNPLNYRSIYTHIPALRNRGVDVDFTNRVPQAPSKIAGDGQHGAPGAALTHPFVVEVRDAANTPFAGVPITFEITGGDGSLSETATQTDAKGQAETTLTLGATGGLTKVTASVRDAQTLIVPQKVTFTANALPVTIPDARLRAEIERALGKNAGAPISTADMATLTSLDASRNFTSHAANISDLTGLEHATNLTYLEFDWNSISDLSALRGLTNLTWLHLRGNPISDISALRGLTNLTYLYLGGDSISDISALRGLTNLTRLWLDNNSVSDLSALSGLTNLTWLWLENNSVSDLSALRGLTNLGVLSLVGNSISDISALRGLTNLGGLSLGGNSISDISALRGLTNLGGLSLGGNSISDISALRGLTNLTSLHLWDNSVSDISALRGLTNLTSLYLDNNSVSDLSALRGLTKLYVLSLVGNSISDLSPLRGLTNLGVLSLVGNSISDLSGLGGLTNLTTLDLEDNPLNYRSIYTHIPALRNRGVDVDFTNRVPQAPSKIAGDGQHGAPGAALTHPFVVEVRDAANTPFAGVPITFEITGGDGSLSETATQTDARGQAQTTLTLGATGGLTKVTASVRDAQTLIVPQKVTFTTTAGLSAGGNPLRTNY